MVLVRPLIVWPAFCGNVTESSSKWPAQSQMQVQVLCCPRSKSGRKLLCPANRMFCLSAMDAPPQDDKISDSHDLLIFGEASKYVWYLCPSVQADRGAMYVMLQEFLDVCMAVKKVSQSGFEVKKAEQSSRTLIKLSVPEYTYDAQKMDFFNFNEALYILATERLPGCSVHARSAWLCKVTNRITRPSTLTEINQIQMSEELQSERTQMGAMRQNLKLVVGEFDDPVSAAIEKVTLIHHTYTYLNVSSCLIPCLRLRLVSCLHSFLLPSLHSHHYLWAR